MESKLCKDHLGNEFNSIKEMCKHWGICKATYYNRLKHGLSLKDILTKNIVYNTKYKDHLNNEFDSIKEMCKYWKISEKTYNRRIKNGWSLKDALTKNINLYKNGCKDHLGNKFNSTTEMCRYWNISTHTFENRLNNNWSLKDALTKPIRHKHETSKKCKDHLNNEFNSIKEMCEYWNIDKELFRDRQRRGWSLEDALTKTIKHNINTCKDPLGNEFNSVKEMREYHHIDKNIYDDRRKRNYCDLEILGIIPIISIKTKIGTQITKNLKLVEISFDELDKYKTTYYICENENGFKDIYTRNELINLMAKEKDTSITYDLSKS